MPVSSEVYEQQRTVAEPTENQMFTRRGLDRKGLRFELADPNDLAIDTDYIEREDKSIPDPRTMSMPVSPTGAGEVGGGGMETLRLDGERWRSYRYAHGFEMNREAGEDDVAEQRNYILESMDFLFDLNAIFGMENTEDWNGLFDELRSRIPAERTFDCEDFDGDTGDEDYSGVEEDLIVGDAMKAIEGEVIDFNEGWQLAVGAHDAITQMNYGAGETDSVTRGPSFKERMQDANAVQNFARMPYKTQLDYLPDDADADIPEFEQYDIVDTETAVDPSGPEPLGYDELFLFPNMETVMSEYWDLRETGTPEHYMTEARQGKIAHDYVSRFSAKADPLGMHPDFTDMVHIQNVSALYGR